MQLGSLNVAKNKNVIRTNKNEGQSYRYKNHILIKQNYLVDGLIQCNYLIPVQYSIAHQIIPGILLMKNKVMENLI